MVNQETHEVYHLKYPSRASMLSDLKNKGVITEGNNDQGEAIDQLSQIALGCIPKLSDETPTGLDITVTPEVRDENGDIVTPAVKSNEYHISFVGVKGLDFNPNRINPNTPQHTFAGWN